MSTHPLRTFRDSHVPPMSRAALADLIGVAAPTVWRWENGVREIDRDLLPRIVKKTGIPAAALRPDLAALLEPRPC